MTLSETRTHLPRSVNDWIDGVLAGKSNVAMASECRVTIHAIENRARMFAEWTGLPPKSFIRETVLRMRIEELSDGR